MYSAKPVTIGPIGKIKNAGKKHGIELRDEM